MRIRRVVLVTACLALIVGSANVATATFPGGNGKILYWDSSYKTMRPDGSNGRWTGIVDAAEVVYSPDGTTMAFAQWGWYVPDTPGVYLFDPTTEEQTLVIATDELPGSMEFVEDLAFAPSGDALVLCASASVGGDVMHRLFTVGTDGTGLTKISGDRNLCFPDWSSTDRILAVDLGRTRRVLRTMGPDGTDLQRVTRLPRPKNPDRRDGWLQPSWSPDGASIAFEAPPEGQLRNDIWLIDVDGTDLRNVTETPRRWEWTVHYSPDGTMLLVTRGGRSMGGNAEDIWLFGVAGGRQRLTDTPAPREEWGVDWAVAT